MAQVDDLIVAAGDFTAQIGQDAAHVVVERTITLAGEQATGVLTLDSAVGQWLANPVVGPTLQQGMAATMTSEQRAQAAANPDGLKMVGSMPMQRLLAFTGAAIPPPVPDQLMESSRLGAPA